MAVSATVSIFFKASKSAKMLYIINVLITFARRDGRLINIQGKIDTSPFSLNFLQVKPYYGTQYLSQPFVSDFQTKLESLRNVPFFT